MSTRGAGPLRSSDQGVSVPLGARLVVPQSVVTTFLRLTGANRTFVSAAGARRRIRARSLRPAPFGPPSTLRSDVRVDVELRGAWPVYRVTRRDGVSSGSVVYVHGGGWVGEIVSQHWHLIAQIAAESATTVVVPIYGLVPFGTAEEARRGVVDLVASSTGPVALAGDSAGGQIALSAALSLRDAGVVVPRTVLIAPRSTSAGATRGSRRSSRVTRGSAHRGAGCCPSTGAGPSTSATPRSARCSAICRGSALSPCSRGRGTS